MFFFCTIYNDGMYCVSVFVVSFVMVFHTVVMVYTTIFVCVRYSFLNVPIIFLFLIIIIIIIFLINLKFPLLVS